MTAQETCACTIRREYTRINETYFSEHLEIAYCPLHQAAPELLKALTRLLRALEADIEGCPSMDVLTAFETNSQAIQHAKAAITAATQPAESV